MSKHCGLFNLLLLYCKDFLNGVTLKNPGYARIDSL